VLPNGGSLLHTAGNVLRGVVFFLVMWIAARLLRKIVRRALAGRKVRADVALLTERVLYVGLIGLGAFMFIALALDQGATALAGVLVAVFVASLGLQDLFKNYVAGFYVLMERHVLPGCVITTGNFTGVVTEVQMRTTYLRTDRGEVVIVPNVELFSSTVAVRPAGGDAGSVEGSQDDARQDGKAAPREL
jgi:small-conductance mechanosensitive channel